MDDRMIMALVEKAANALERSAVANENLLHLAEEQSKSLEWENPPPVCPFCFKTNPEVTPEENDETHGPISDFVFVGQLHCCGRKVYGIPLGMTLLPTIEAARLLMTEQRTGTHEQT
jgi:hypothetical protein